LILLGFFLELCFDFIRKSDFGLGCFTFVIRVELKKTGKDEKVVWGEGTKGDITISSSLS